MQPSTRNILTGRSSIKLLLRLNVLSVIYVKYLTGTKKKPTLSRNGIVQPDVLFNEN